MGGCFGLSGSLFLSILCPLRLSIKIDGLLYRSLERERERDLLLRFLRGERERVLLRPISGGDADRELDLSYRGLYGDLAWCMAV